MNTKDCGPINDDIPAFESRHAAPEEWIKEKRVLKPSFLGIFFKIINVLVRCHTASHTSAANILNDDSNVIDWIIETNELQALDDLTVSLPTLKLLKKQKYDQFAKIIQATNAGDSKSGFYEDNNDLLRRRHPSIPGIQ